MLSAGLSWAALAITATIGIALIGLLMRHGGKLESILTSIRGLEQRDDENREDHREMWSKLGEHGERIAVIEGRKW